MKLQPYGLIVAVCMVASVFSGCAARDRVDPQSDSRGKQTGAKKDCQWTYEFGVNTKKIDKDSVELTEESKSKKCEVKHFGPPLFIGDSKAAAKEVKDISAAEFYTEGSCRYCYINTGGGMTCIIIPNC